MDRDEAIRVAGSAIIGRKTNITQADLRVYGADGPGGEMALVNGLIAVAGALLDQLGGDQAAHVNAALRSLLD